MRQKPPAGIFGRQIKRFAQPGLAHRAGLEVARSRRWALLSLAGLRDSCGKSGGAMVNTSQSLFERGMKVLVEGVSSASRGPATFGGAPRYMSHGAGRGCMMSMGGTISTG